MEQRHPDIDWSLVERYITADLTGAEQRRAERLLAEHPRLRAMCEDIERQLDPLTERARQAFVGQAYEALRGRLARGTDTGTDEGGGPADVGRQISRNGNFAAFGSWSGERKGLGRWTLRRVIWLTGSSVVLGTILAFVGWMGGIHVGQPVTSMSTYTTNPGQRANITLPDGSTVALGVASRLDVPADYGRGHHTVRLTGEALFTVVHRDRTPFTVLVRTTAVRVLGTSFMVRNYATDRTMLVAVRDGKVAVRSAIVSAQQQIEVSRSGVGRIRPAEPAQFSFAAGMLTLNCVPFSAAVEELNRWYDVDIRLGDPKLNAQTVTAKLPAGSLADLTTLLTLTFDVRVVRNGRVLTIFPK